MKTFYMCFVDVSGKSSPTVKHEDKATAIGECERLATLHPGERVFLLRAVSYAIAPTGAKWTDLSNH